jgi:predicted ATPase
MRITAIELENFKGIGPRQRVELHPITLLFGPNSAGKSTVLQALHYAREILERQNVDPDVTIAGGLLDLGGFATLVHQHDLGRPVRIKLEVDLSREQGAEELPLNSGVYREDQDFSELRVRYLEGKTSPNTHEGEVAASGAQIGSDNTIVQEAGVEFEVQWSEQIQRPYVSRIGVELDGHALAAIVSPPNGWTRTDYWIQFPAPAVGTCRCT